MGKKKQVKPVHKAILLFPQVTAAPLQNIRSAIRIINLTSYSMRFKKTYLYTILHDGKIRTRQTEAVQRWLSKTPKRGTYKPKEFFLKSI